MFTYEFESTKLMLSFLNTKGNGLNYFKIEDFKLNPTKANFELFFKRPIGLNCKDLRSSFICPPYSNQIQTGQKSHLPTLHYEIQSEKIK